MNETANESTKKSVYLAISADFLHPGHLNIIQKARELGEVTVGVLSDRAIASFKRVPILNYEQRKIIMENIQGIKSVICQDSWDYTENLTKLQPDYVVHGTDWREGPQKKFREKVIQCLKKWDGELIEPEYTKHLSSSHIVDSLRRQGTTPELRRSALRRLLQVKPLVRALEVHNGLTGLIVENAKVSTESNIKEFDCMWESSLTDSTSKGKPDNSSVDISSRVQTIEQILEVTTKPMIVDADNGGLPEHFLLTVKTLERLGVSAVIIEDKIGPKRNSLFGTEVHQLQDSIENFCTKISLGKKAQLTDDFCIFARVESLILNLGMEDAIKRATAYVEAGADGIMIHSKKPEADEIIEFVKRFRKIVDDVPLIVVPSTYDHITETELEAIGVNVVIYANQLIRSAYPAMENTAKKILQYGRAYEVREDCLPIKDIISFIPIED